MKPQVPFIYGLVDSGEPNHVRYVGMASVDARRPYFHIKDACKESAKLSYKVNWIRSVIENDRECLVVILEEMPKDTTRRVLGETEKSYITKLIHLGHRLTNLTEGGEGRCGPIFSRSTG